MPEVDEEEFKQNMSDMLFDDDLESSRSGSRYFYSSQEWLKQISPETVRAEITAKIPITQFFAGHSSLDYRADNIVTLPISFVKDEGGNRRSDPKLYIFCGARGDGKTIFGKELAVEHGIGNYQLQGLTIDSSKVLEHQMSRYASTSKDVPLPQGPFSDAVIAKLNAYFHLVGLKPRGFSNVVYKPWSRFVEDGIDKLFKYTYRDFERLEYFVPGEGQQSLADVLDIGDLRPALAIIKQALNNRSIQYFQDIVDAISIGTLNPDSFSVGSQHLDPASFLKYLDAAKGANIIADENAVTDARTGAPVSGDIVNDMLTHDFVCLRHKLRTSSSDSRVQVPSSMAVKLVLNNILNERAAGISGNAEERERSRLKSKAGLMFFLEEADSVMPSKGDSYTSKLSENLGSKERKTGASVTAVVQDIENLAEEFANQADGIFTSQLNLPGNERFFRRQLEGVYSDKAIDKMMGRLRSNEMERQVKNSLGFPVSPFRFFDMHTHLFSPRIYPRFPLCMFKIT